MTRAKAGLIVAGGGTGGHVLAGVAIADAWTAQKSGALCSQVLFVGAEGGIEERLVPRAGYPLERLRIGSLNRVKFSRKLRTLSQLPISFIVSAGILLRERPRAVIGVGGYASGPVVLLARLLGWIWGGARVAILEQNAVPGLTNRILGRFAHQILLAFPTGDGVFPKAKTRVTGNPVRAQLQPNAEAGVEPFRIFIFGGSQGALGINSLVLEALPHLLGVKDHLRFLHQTGEKELERVRAGYQKLGTAAQVVPFIDDMAACYRDATLVICRAGSSTLSELAMVRRAAILIPFPFAADNHQEKNARIFVDRGAAQMLVQGKSTGRDLADLIHEYLRFPEKIKKMELAIADLARPNAAAEIVKELIHATR